MEEGAPQGQVGRGLHEEAEILSRGALMTLRSIAWALPVFVVLGSPGHAQSPELAPDPPSPPRKLRLHAEIKTHFRHSDLAEVPLRFPFPPDFLPPEGAVFLRTVSAGDSLEVSNVAIVAEATLTPDI